MVKKQKPTQDNEDDSDSDDLDKLLAKAKSQVPPSDLNFDKDSDFEVVKDDTVKEKKIKKKKEKKDKKKSKKK